MRALLLIGLIALLSACKEDVDPTPVSTGFSSLPTCSHLAPGVIQPGDFEPYGDDRPLNPAQVQSLQQDCNSQPSYDQLKRSAGMPNGVDRNGNVYYQLPDGSHIRFQGGQR